MGERLCLPGEAQGGWAQGGCMQLWLAPLGEPWECSLTAACSARLQCRRVHTSYELRRLAFAAPTELRHLVSPARPQPLQVSEESSTSPALLLGGGVAVVLAAAALTSTNEQGAFTAATSEPAPAAPATPAALSPEADAVLRKAEAQAWIKAWRDKQQLSPEAEAARRKGEAQAWIKNWRAKQQK